MNSCEIPLTFNSKYCWIMFYGLDILTHWKWSSKQLWPNDSIRIRIKPRQKRTTSIAHSCRLRVLYVWFTNKPFSSNSCKSSFQYLRDNTFIVNAPSIGKQMKLVVPILCFSQWFFIYFCFKEKLYICIYITVLPKLKWK